MVDLFFMSAQLRFSLLFSYMPKRNRGDAKAILLATQLAYGELVVRRGASIIRVTQPRQRPDKLDQFGIQDSRKGYTLHLISLKGF